MANEKEILFEIKEQLGIIATYSTGWSKELNLVSWNGGAPKFDIRDWNPDHLHMSKGVTLRNEEMTKLLEIALAYNSQRVLDKAKAEREARLERSRTSRSPYANQGTNSETGNKAAGSSPEPDPGLEDLTSLSTDDADAIPGEAPFVDGMQVDEDGVVIEAAMGADTSAGQQAEAF